MVFKVLNMYYHTFSFLNATILFSEIKALTKRLDQQKQTLELKVETKRKTMQKEEIELQKQVDTFRSSYSKIESEKLLKEEEVIEIRKEVTAIRSQITQVKTLKRSFIIKIFNSLGRRNYLNFF